MFVSILKFFYQIWPVTTSCNLKSVRRGLLTPWLLKTCLHYFADDGSKHLTASISQSQPETYESSRTTSSSILHLLHGRESKPERLTIARLAPVQDASAEGCSSFAAHPAQADAVLHLGAVETQRSNAARCAMVPVGLAALMSRNLIHRNNGHGWSIAGQYFSEQDLLALLCTSFFCRLCNMCAGW